MGKFLLGVTAGAIVVAVGYRVGMVDKLEELVDRVKENLDVSPDDDLSN